MRIAVHDYPGHPFQVQLSRSLAARGHDVLHLFSASFSGPKGALSRQNDDPPNFDVQGLDVGSPAPKHRLFRRWMQERRYGSELIGALGSFGEHGGRPDVVLTANTPSFILAEMGEWCREEDIPLVVWVQDLYGEAARTLLGRRFGPVGRWIGSRWVRMEAEALRACSGIIAISDEFVPVIRDLAGSVAKIEVIQNWTPLEDVPVVARENEWRGEHGLTGRFVFLYSGTLGMKHNPGLLMALAERFEEDREVAVVVISEGAGADWLAAEASARGMENLRVLGFQPFSKLPLALGAADVFVGVLEPEAAGFSVPSKVLTYLAAGRPILLSVVPGNLAAQTVREARAGLVAEPGDAGAFLEAARALRSDPDGRAAMGTAGRAWAETHFDIEAISDRFEAELRHAADMKEVG